MVILLSSKRLHSSVVSLYSNRNVDSNRLNVNGNNWNDNNNGYAFGMVLVTKITIMKTYNNLYPKIYSRENLILAWEKARKGKTRKPYVIEFEKNLEQNLLDLQSKLKTQTYKPRPLETFVLRDPKTRVISKSDFRDRVIHHAIINIIEPVFEPTFIYDSCANRKGKGNLFAIKRFDKFIKKVSRNGKTNGQFDNNQIIGHCLKADIKHYFQEVDHKILSSILRRKIRDEKVIWLVQQILTNRVGLVSGGRTEKGMPLGNLTSQFFANIYLNELDYFVKRVLRARFYIRYVDDFVILHNSKGQLGNWRKQIDEFLLSNLKIELHEQKSRVIRLSQGIDFVGFRNFYLHKRLRRRNIRKMFLKVIQYHKGLLTKEKILESFQGWQACARWTNSFKLRNQTVRTIYPFTSSTTL